MARILKSVLVGIGTTLFVMSLVGCDPETAVTERPAPGRAPSPAAATSAATPESTPTAAAVAVAPIVTREATASAARTAIARTPVPRPTPTTAPGTASPTASPESTATVAPVAIPTAIPTTTVAATARPKATPEPTATAAPTPQNDVSLAFDPLVTRGTLSNGMVYYIRQNQEPRERVQLWLIVKAGSILEEEEERGLAHFVEHMAFNGTERFAKQEIVEYLESIGSNLGPDVNASTGFDSTNYFLEIPTDDPEVLETAFQILSDWAYAVAFDPEEVELERGVVVEEWRLRRGFGARFQDNWYPLIFGDSRYNERSPIGLLEVVETAPPERLRGFYERWYRPDLMAVIAVGDIDTEEIEAKIRQHFAPPPEGEAGQTRAAAAEPSTRPRFDLPEHSEPRVNVFSDPEAPGTQLFLLRKLPPESGQDEAALRRIIVDRLAFMMLNARLFERGQVEDPPYLWAGGSRGRFVDPIDLVQFGAWVEQDGVQPGFAAVLEETQRARQHGFTESELAREKTNLLSAIERIYKEREQRESADFAQEYADHFLNGIPAPGIEAEWQLYQAMLPEISLTDVHEVAASWAEPGNTVLLVMRPEGGEELNDDELASVLQAQLAVADSLAVEPYADEFADVPLLAELPTPGAIVDEEQIESIDAVRWTLSNGITVIAKQTDFKNDEIVFGAFSPGGHSLVDDSDHVSALYADQLIAGSGVGEHDNVALDKLLAGKRVSVSPFIGELFEGFRGQSSPEDIETLFQLVTLYATAPRLDPVYFSTYERSLRTLAETRADQPDAVFSDTVNTVLSQNHFRRRPLTLELVDELSIERAEAVYADRFADLGDATFVFVGAFEWESLRYLTETYLASLPATGRVEHWKDVGIDPPTALEEHAVHIGIEPRSRTRVYFAGDLEWSRHEALSLTVMAEMLTTRLRERLREQLGGTYSVGASARASLLPDSEYRISIGFGSDPARADELLMEVFEELAWLRDGGEQEYLDTVKELLRNPREEQLRENGFWLGQIQSAVQRDLDFYGITDFEDRLDALTLEDVVAAAQRYLTEDRYVRVVLLPEEG